MSHNTKGYTLIEVIIALAIFAILSTLSVGLLSRAFDTKARLKAQLNPISELNLAVARITQDAAQILPRLVYDKDMTKHDAFMASTDRIEFTRGGLMPLANEINPSSLRRVALVCENHQLIRETWEKLDGFNPRNAKQQILLDNLENCSFSFASKDHDWADTWQENKVPYPSAFKLQINLNGLGEADLIFTIPGGMRNDE